MKQTEIIIEHFRSLSNQKYIEGMIRVGIKTDKAFGIPLPIIRNIAKQYKKNHVLALDLWNTQYHEARLLASMIDNSKQVTENQMNDWCFDFDSWDICDQCCSNLFSKTPFAAKKAMEWTSSEKEFVKRAGFVMMAYLAIHDKKMNDDIFIHHFFPLIIKHSSDKRNYVRKAINWSLRQIGKRNLVLHNEAIQVSNELIKTNDKTARWIGTDAYRELSDVKTINRLTIKKK